MRPSLAAFRALQPRPWPHRHQRRRLSGSSLQQGAAWLDGGILPIAEARLPVNDWGLTHSDVVYDVAPVWGGGFFRLGDYLERFEASMAACRVDVGMERGAMEAALSTMVAASGLREAYVAMVASRGLPAPGSRDPRDCASHFFAWCVPYVRILKPEVERAGACAWVAKSVRRIPPECLDPKVKNYQWGDFNKGMLEAKERGAETVVLLDQAGNVTEGPGFNVFSVQAKGRLVTASSGVLEGITRRTVMEISAELGYTLEVRPLPLEEFMESQEVFISSTAGGVMALGSVDGHALPGGAPGEVTRRISERYWEWVRRPAMRSEIDYGGAA